MQVCHRVRHSPKAVGDSSGTSGARVTPSSSFIHAQHYKGGGSWACRPGPGDLPWFRGRYYFKVANLGNKKGKRPTIEPAPKLTLGSGFVPD